ncbi:uncharacterized protein METZ01_LOCUS286819, partial [marine metagenome]
MGTWKIYLENQTATSINGITFKLTETKPGEYEGVCLNPKDIPPDDLDDVILGRMIYRLRYNAECTSYGGLMASFFSGLIDYGIPASLYETIPPKHSCIS